MCDIEIICVDAGSTDGTLTKLRNYENQVYPGITIKVFESLRKSYGFQVNLGLKAATGKYVAILETDDYVASCMYEELYKLAEENDLDFVKADFYRFKTMENGERELVCNHLSQKERDYNKVFNPSMTPEALRYIMNTWSGIYKRRFLEEYHMS